MLSSNVSLKFIKTILLINIKNRVNSERLANPLTNSSLFNGMIYPFTRMVIYGIIWYQGESNSGRNNDKYVCTFTNLIQSWRQIWNQRTNGITNIQFPFGFVQV
jgi:sialate O-acetylesterase